MKRVLLKTVNVFSRTLVSYREQKDTIQRFDSVA
ncbi:MAG: hypothetical protein H6Q65_93 [Firmicutes bacterium]|nr:hypothetical protein [Bacillota bacterium]